MSVSLTSQFLANARGLTLEDANGISWSINSNTNQITAAYAGGGSSGGANPSAKIGLTTVNGAAATFMRSDGAPPLDQSIAPTWTGVHTFSVAPVIGGIAWTAPTLLNSWANYGAPYAVAGYYKDPTGRVWLRGMVYQGSSGAATIMTLPAGYRPTATMLFASVSAGVFCEIQVDSSGNVSSPVGGTPTWIALNNISFATF